MYAQDYDEVFPIASNWMDATASYIPKDVQRSTQASFYHCPSQPRDFTLPGYAYNDAMNKRRLADIPEPARMVMIYDSTTVKRNAHDALTSLPIPGRHLKGNMIGFVDGRAQWIKDGTLDTWVNRKQ